MKFQYACEHCSVKPPKSIKQVDGYEIIGYHTNAKEFLFIIEGKIGCAPNPSKVKCPICGLKNCHRSYTDSSLTMYVRGQGIVTDTDGARRDMNSFTLRNKDPYHTMRQSGEKDYLLDRLRRAGMDLNKGKPTLEEIESRRKKMSDSKVAEILAYGSLPESHRDVLEKIYASPDSALGFNSLSYIVDDINKVLSDLLNVSKLIIKKKDGRFALMPGTSRLIEDYREHIGI